MPLFDWQATSARDITGPHFWIFWALLTPMSVGMVIFIYYVQWIQERTERASSLESSGEHPLPGDDIRVVGV
jgi:hypothetical protein